MHVTEGFIPDMWRYYGASDVVLTRAGATNMAECAALNRPTVVMPNPLLTGGHQLHNAAKLESIGAIQVVHEGNLDELAFTLKQLLTDINAREQLSGAIAKMAKIHAAQDIALEIIGYLGAGK